MGWDKYPIAFLCCSYLLSRMWEYIWPYFFPPHMNIVYNGRIEGAFLVLASSLLLMPIALKLLI